MGKHLKGTWNCHLTQTSSYLKVKTIGRKVLPVFCPHHSMAPQNHYDRGLQIVVVFNWTVIHERRLYPNLPTVFFFCRTFVVVCLWPTNVKTMWMIQWPVRTKQSHKTYNTNTNLKQNHKFHNTYAKNSTTQTQTSLCLCCRVLC